MVEKTGKDQGLDSARPYRTDVADKPCRKLSLRIGFLGRRSDICARPGQISCDVQCQRRWPCCVAKWTDRHAVEVADTDAHMRALATAYVFACLKHRLVKPDAKPIDNLCAEEDEYEYGPYAVSANSVYTPLATLLRLWVAPRHGR